MISVITPSRKRPAALLKSLDSLCDKAYGDIEIHVRFDDDDAEYAEAVFGQKQYKDNVHGPWWHRGPRHGYRNLHLYYNELAAKAKGDWLFLWNDDAIMETEGWDEIINQYAGMVILNPGTNHSQSGSMLFPIIPRKMYEVMGHFSMNRHNDTYIEHIGRVLGITVDIPVTIFHDRFDVTGNNDDEVAAEREYDPNFWSDENVQNMNEDIEKLRPFI